MIMHIDFPILLRHNIIFAKIIRHFRQKNRLSYAIFYFFYYHSIEVGSTYDVRFSYCSVEIQLKKIQNFLKHFIELKQEKKNIHHHRRMS